MELLSIGNASKATGLSTETIRIWERRYGRPVAHRTASGHRRYSADQVAWLTRMKKVVASGIRPGQAVKLSDDDLRALTQERPEVAKRANLEVDRLVGMIEGLDGGALVMQLDAAWRRHTPASYAQEVVAPLMARLGAAAEDGKIDSRHEQYACGIIEDHMHARAAGGIVDRDGPRVALLGAVAGPRCRVIMQAAALLCATEHMPHTMLPPLPKLGEGDPRRVDAAVDMAEADILALCVPPSGENRRLVEHLVRTSPSRVCVLQLGEGATPANAWPLGVDVIDSYEAWTQWLRGIRSERYRAVG